MALIDLATFRIRIEPHVAQALGVGTGASGVGAAAAARRPGAAMAPAVALAGGRSPTPALPPPTPNSTPIPATGSPSPPQNAGSQRPAGSGNPVGASAAVRQKTTGAYSAPGMRRGMQMARGAAGVVIGRSMSAMPLLMGFKLTGLIAFAGQVSGDIRQSKRYFERLNKMGISRNLQEFGEQINPSGLPSFLFSGTKRSFADATSDFWQSRGERLRSSFDPSQYTVPEMIGRGAIGAAELGLGAIAEVVDALPVFRHFAEEGKQVTENVLSFLGFNPGPLSRKSQQEVFDSMVAQERMNQRVQDIRDHQNNDLMSGGKPMVGSSPFSFGVTQTIGANSHPWFVKKSNDEIDEIRKRSNELIRQQNEGRFGGEY